MTEPSPFLQRVLSHLPPVGAERYQFRSWSVPDKVTPEGVGLLRRPAIPGDVIDRVFDVDRYVGHVGHVVACRSIEDPRYRRPQQVRFYQRIKIPLLGQVHHELLLTREGELQGYQVAAFHLLEPGTAALDPRQAVRSQYAEGAWLASPSAVGYALSSAPRRDDVGRLKWLLLTKGAEVTAASVIREAIGAMVHWAAAEGGAGDAE